MIHRSDRFTNAGGQTQRRQARSHHQVDREFVLELDIWYVPDRPVDPEIEPVFLNVVYDSDHRVPGIRRTYAPYPLAERILARPRTPRELLAYDDHGQARSRVLFVYQAASCKRDSQGLQVIRSHQAM